MCVCVSQAGRDRKGRARRSHRVRTDVVLTALKGKMPTKGLGGGCPLGHTAVTNNNNNNSHHHQSGHGHSALDLEEPLVGEGVMRYLCRPTGQHDGGNSGTGLKTRKGKRVGARSSSGLTLPAPDSALSPQSRVEVAPRVRVWAEVAAAAGRRPGCGWGFLCWGRDLVLATVPHPWRHNRVPWEVSRARRTCEFEASEESLFQRRMHSRPPLAPVPCSQCILKDPEPSWPLGLPQCKLHTWGHLLPAPH